MPTGLADPYTTLFGSPKSTLVALPVASITTLPICHTNYFEYAISDIGGFSVSTYSPTLRFNDPGDAELSLEF